jgi:CheY-like chemotaxis protein
MNAPETKTGQAQSWPHTPARVLVVDDDYNIVSHLGRFLSSQGFSVMLANNGEEALKIFKTRPVDLVLSDVKMPKMNGVKLLKSIKQINPRVPVVLISGYLDVHTVVEALKSGAENYLTKPFRLKELLKVVDQSLSLNCIRLATSDNLIRLNQTTAMELPSKPDWIGTAVNQLSLSAVAMGFCSYDLDNNIKLAITEAITNAMEHGNKWDEAKTVCITMQCDKNRIEISILDQGDGFEVSELPDPTDEVNLLSERGRGVFLMRSIMDEVHYAKPGNCITLIKHKAMDDDQA